MYMCIYKESQTLRQGSQMLRPTVVHLCDLEEFARVWSCAKEVTGGATVDFLVKCCASTYCPLLRYLAGFSKEKN